MDFFTKALIMLLVLLLPPLGYLILRSDPPTGSGPTLGTTQTFAQFIEARPAMVESREPTPEALEIFGGLKAEPLPIDLLERLQQYEQKWSEVGSARGPAWRSEMQDLFKIAQKYETPFALDLLRKQILEIKNDPSAENRKLAQEWKTRYLQLDPRPFAVAEIKSAYPDGDEVR